MPDMETVPEFIRWSAAHWGALGMLAFVSLSLFVGGKRCTEAVRVYLCRGVAVVMLLLTAAEFAYRALESTPDPHREYLPLHYCSVMMFISAYALWTRAKWASAMVYFSVLTASVQALITPALHFGFPHPRYFFFFLSHGSLFLAALALPLLRDWRARKWDPVLTLALMDVYMLCVIPVNLLLGTNYGFTQEAPPGSILSYLGPAPWYFFILHLPGLLVFYLLFLFVKEKGRSN